MPNMPMFSMESDEDDTKPAATAEPRLPCDWAIAPRATHWF